METGSPNASGSLRNAHGRKDTLSRKTSYSIFMYMIFNPLIIGSGFPFNIIALFKMKCKSKALALCAIAQSYWSKGVACIDKLACPLPDRPRTSASSDRIARTLHGLPHLRTANRTAERRRDLVRVVWLFQSTFYFA